MEISAEFATYLVTGSLKSSYHLTSLKYLANCFLPFNNHYSVTMDDLSTMTITPSSHDPTLAQAPGLKILSSSHLSGEFLTVKMTISLTNLSKYYRSNTPEKPDLKHGVRAYYNGTTITLSDAQIIALTLNEICAQLGHGIVYWLPSFTSNVEAPDTREKIVSDLEYSDQSLPKSGLQCQNSGPPLRRLTIGTRLKGTVSNTVRVCCTSSP